MTCSPSRIPIFWLIRAQDQLDNALGAAEKIDEKEKQVADPNTHEDAGTPLKPECDRAWLDEILRATFVDSQVDGIVVLERLGGYRSKVCEHVLRVECCQGTKTFARVVKIAPPGELAKEWGAWQSCERSANDRGRAFMMLTPGPSVPSGQQPKAATPGGQVQPPASASTPVSTGIEFQSLVYEDALQTLCAGQVLSFEQAALNCCRWNVPTVGSLINVLDQIYAELFNRLYSRAAPAVPDEEFRKIFVKTRISDGLERLNEYSKQPAGSRRFARSELGKEKDRVFLDLLEFHRRVLKPGDWPELLMGPAHGDLHGNNILVGLVGSEARWPAVFDYEDMSLHNVVAWDFVKLEHELKIRALQKVYPVGNDAFVTKVYEFEHELALCTEMLNNRSIDSWQEAPRQANPKCELNPKARRLKTLVLGIRRQAKRYLEVEHRLGRRWLHEYYFVAATYGLHAGKFANYRSQDELASYVCAGYCAYRHLWAVNRLRFSKEDARNKANEAVMRDDEQAELAAPENVGFEIHLAFDGVLVRSRKLPLVERGMQLLQKLHADYPAIPNVVQELAFTYLQLADLSRAQRFDVPQAKKYERDALKLLADFERDQKGLYAFDIEFQSRNGKCFKMYGDALLDAANDLDELKRARIEARPWYDGALRAYEMAYRHSKDHYPGINCATLSFFLDNQEQSKAFADEVLFHVQAFEIGTEKHSPEDVFWARASRAEALLLNCQHAESLAQYSGVLRDKKYLTEHARETMASQGLRILLFHDSSPATEQLMEFLRKLRTPKMSAGDG